MAIRISAFILLAVVSYAQPLTLDSRNPHYFFFRGKPAVLVTSGEHYGAVINRSFDYVTYLNELTDRHLNLTRIWVGPYREVAGNFGIQDNTLAPRPEMFLPPWQRQGDRFDLKTWNPTYFQRLRAFVQAASERGIVVEVNLFCPFYEESMWRVSPLNALNNTNGIGSVPRTEALTMQHPDLVAVEEEMVRKIVTELNGFGNVYYEICNEPYFGGVTDEWQRHIAGVIRSTENTLPERHLISQNIANGSKRVQDPNPLVSVFNFHYSRPPESVALNYDLNRVIGYNETGFDGSDDAVYRTQGWDFLMAGGALYNNLDYSFTVGHERGDFQYGPGTPGGGTRTLRNQLGIMREFFDGLNLERLMPVDLHVLFSPAAHGASRSLRTPDGYVIYLHHGYVVHEKPRYRVDSAFGSQKLQLQLEPGIWSGFSLDPKTGKRTPLKEFTAGDVPSSLETPAYSQDLVLILHKNEA
jgi:hypothetical protein